MNWNDDDLDLALRELKDEPLAPGAEEAVRARVFSELEQPRRRWFQWAWAPALAAGLVLLWLRPQPDIPPSPLIAKSPPPPVAQAPDVVQVPEVGQAPGLRRPLRPPKAPPPQTHFVKLVTDDPDVVILWAMNSEGEAQ